MKISLIIYIIYDNNHNQNIRTFLTSLVLLASTTAILFMIFSAKRKKSQTLRSNYIRGIYLDNKNSNYLILREDGTGTCSAMTGNTDLNRSVGRKMLAVREDNFQIKRCL